MLPIQVPELLAATTGDAGVCLLMSAHDPSGKAVEWSDARWVEVASQAGRPHRYGESVDLPVWLDRVPEPQNVCSCNEQSSMEPGRLGRR
jgi:hypothetical protein